MKKLILTIIVLIQILASGISGCLEEEKIVEKSTQLSDGTEVTGDIGDIEIIDYEITREKKLYFENRWENTSYKYSLNAIVPRDLNIVDILTNFKNLSTKVRVLKIPLETGTEILLTNLHDSDLYPHSIFKELYYIL